MNYPYLFLGDENPVESKNGSIEEDFAVWKDTFLTNIQKRNEKEDIKQEAVEEEEEYESDSESEQEQSEGKKSFIAYHEFYLISFNCFYDY